MAIETESDVRTLDVETALKILRRWRRDIGKPHSRIHKDTASDNAHCIRVLEFGDCGRCSALHLESTQTSSKESVSIRCDEGHSPLDMSRQTPLGETPKCPGF